MTFYKADAGASCYNIAVSHAQMEGSRHRKDRHPCEDVVWIRSTQDYLFCGLADGQSGTQYGAEGGKACLEAVSDFIGSVGIGSLLDARFPDELPCAIVQVFRKKLLSLAKSRSAGWNEFASTLLALAVDRKTGRYMLIHLGDGCAISIPDTGEPTAISAPENGLLSYHTWLTTSDHAVSHLRVSFGSLDNKKRILIMSDGAACFCRNREIPWRMRELLKNGSQPALQKRLEESDPVDDATCIIVDCFAESGTEDEEDIFLAKNGSGEYNKNIR